MERKKVTLYGIMLLTVIAGAFTLAMPELSMALVMPHCNSACAAGSTCAIRNVFCPSGNCTWTCDCISNSTGRVVGNCY